MGTRLRRKEAEGVPAQNVCFKDTSQYKKEGPDTIGFSNAGLGDSWCVVALHSMMKAAG